MSHRTASLPELTGLRRILRELRYHEASRQLLGLALVALFTMLSAPIAPAVYAGAPLAVAGIALRLWASGHIIKNERLATDGPYGLVRHPLYAGNILVLVGFALASSLWWALPLAIAMMLFYYPTAVEYEDRKLSRIFGYEWFEWRRETNALLPRRLSLPDGAGRWSFRESLRRNGEPVIALFILGLLLLIVARLA